MRDLLCLVPDKNTEAALAALLKRHEALRIRQVQYEIHVHPNRDPGVYHEGIAFVREFQKSHRHALLVLDAAWEGGPARLQEELDRRLAQEGLKGWAATVVIQPELEVWVWSASPQVEHVLGWGHRQPSLRQWLEEKGLWGQGEAKPRDPKRAVELALQATRKPRSSSVYRCLAENVSVRKCKDRSFARLVRILRQWFAYMS